MNKKIKKHGWTLLCLGLMLISTITVSGDVSSRYIHEQDYYSVIYDDDGDAIVAAKLIVQNTRMDDLQRIELEIPGHVLLYNLIQEVPGENYGKSTFYPVEYDKEETNTSVLLTLHLSKKIESQGRGTILLLYKIPTGTKKGFLGVHEFDFETIIDKNAAWIQYARIAITVRQGLYLKGGRTTSRYEPYYFADVQTVHVTAEGIKSTTLSDFSRRITYADGLTRTAYDLDPFESFHVRGNYANARWKLHIQAILVVLVVVILALTILKVFLWKTMKKMFKLKCFDVKNKTISARVIRSCALGFISALSTTIAWLFIKSLGEWLNSGMNYQYSEFIMPLFLLMSGIIILLSLFGSSAYAGSKYGFSEGILALIMTALWLFMFLIVFALLTKVFSDGPYPYYYLSALLS